MNYEINYTYNGKGRAIVKANSQQEAEEMFHEGLWVDDYDDSDTYDIESTKKLCSICESPEDEDGRCDCDCANKDSN